MVKTHSTYTGNLLEFASKGFVLKEGYLDRDVFCDTVVQNLYSLSIPAMLVAMFHRDEHQHFDYEFLHLSPGISGQGNKGSSLGNWNTCDLKIKTSYWKSMKYEIQKSPFNFQSFHISKVMNLATWAHHFSACVSSKLKILGLNQLLSGLQNRVTCNLILSHLAQLLR